MTSFMTKLTPAARNRLLDDYKIAQSNITSILEGAKNYFVIDDDYITPTIDTRRVVPLENPEGMMEYYKKLRDVIETALTRGSIPKNQLPRRSPKLLTDLIIS